MERDKNVFGDLPVSERTETSSSACKSGAGINVVQRQIPSTLFTSFYSNEYFSS